MRGDLRGKLLRESDRPSPRRLRAECTRPSSLPGADGAHEDLSQLAQKLLVAGKAKTQARGKRECPVPIGGHGQDSISQTCRGIVHPSRHAWGQEALQEYLRPTPRGGGRESRNHSASARPRCKGTRHYNRFNRFGASRCDCTMQDNAARDLSSLAYFPNKACQSWVCCCSRNGPSPHTRSNSKCIPDGTARATSYSALAGSRDRHSRVVPEGCRGRLPSLVRSPPSEDDRGRVPGARGNPGR